MHSDSARPLYPKLGGKRDHAFDITPSIDGLSEIFCGSINLEGVLSKIVGPRFD